MPEVKHLAIGNRLENAIRAGKHSDKLPPVRQLSADFGVALQTMTKALKPLVEKGLLDPGPGGTRIVSSMPRRAGIGVVTVFMLGEQPLTDPARDPLLTTLRSEAERDGVTLVLMWVDGDEIFTKPDFWKAGQTDGYIFLYSSFYSVLTRHLNVNGIPFVVANWLPEGANVHWIDFDWRRQLFDLVKQLLDHDYRHIAYLPMIRWQMGAPFHEDLWRDICDYYGIHNYSPGLDCFGSDPLAVMERWHVGEPVFPEVIIPNNTLLPPLMKRLDEIGVATKMVGHHDMIDAHPRMLFWRNNDYTTLGREVWKVFRQLCDGTAGVPHPHLITDTRPVDW